MSRLRGSLPTPHSERIQKLSEKLSSIHIRSNLDRSGKSESIENKLLALEDQMREIHATSSRKLGQLRDQLTRLTQELEEERQHREEIFEMKTKELITLDGQIEDALSNDLAAKKESEQRLSKLLEDRMVNIRSEILRESRSRTDTLEEIKRKIETKLPKLQENLRNETVNRELLESNLMRGLNKELESIRSSVSHEKRAREETEDALMNMFKEVVIRLKGDLEQEKQDRENTEETLLSLLEDTCSKLNVVSQL